jgi:hypothetical protein
MVAYHAHRARSQQASTVPAPDTPPPPVVAPPAPPPASNIEPPVLEPPVRVKHEGTVVVRVDAPDARIEVDGRMIAQSASGARVRVEAGEHAVSVSSPGRRPYRSHIAVGADASVDVPVHLAPIGRGAPAAKAAPSVKPSPAASATARKPPDKIEKQEVPEKPEKPEKGDKKDRRSDPDYLVDPFGAPR